MIEHTITTGQIKVVEGKGLKVRIIEINEGILDRLKNWKERKI